MSDAAPATFPCAPRAETAIHGRHLLFGVLPETAAAPGAPGEPAARAEPFVVVPYSEIARGVRLGFQRDCGVVALVHPAAGPDDVPVLEIADVGGTRFLTLEIDLDAAAVVALRSVMFALTAAAQPQASVRVTTRLWRAGGQFVDVAPRRLHLRVAGGTVSDLVAIDAAAVAEPVERVQLLLFLPVVAARYGLADLAVIPAPA